MLRPPAAGAPPRGPLGGPRLSPPGPPRPRGAGAPQLVGHLPRERDRAERRAIHCAHLVLDEHEDHESTPSRARSATTAGAASGPWPRISMLSRCSRGTISRSFVGPAAEPTGACAA